MGCYTFTKEIDQPSRRLRDATEFLIYCGRPTSFGKLIEATLFLAIILFFFLHSQFWVVFVYLLFLGCFRIGWDLNCQWSNILWSYCIHVLFSYKLFLLYTLFCWLAILLLKIIFFSETIFIYYAFSPCLIIYIICQKVTSKSNQYLN